MTAAMRQAVLERPEDDSLRRVLADALSEAGDPQGEFISHQLALARMDPLDPTRTPLIAATHRLQAAHAEQWLAPLLDTLDTTYRRPVSALRNAHFERGFLTRIALQPEDFGLIAALASQTPLEGVEFLLGEGVSRDDEAPDTSTWRWMALHPDDWFTAHSVAQVLCWGTQSLEELDLSGCSLGEDGARLIVGLPTTLGDFFEGHVEPEPLPEGQLRRLVLHGTELGDAGLALLIEGGERLQGLRGLVLSQCKLTDADQIRALRDSVLARDLDELSIAGNNALDVSPLIGWDRMKSLVRLGVPKSLSAVEFGQLVADSPSLRELDLAGAKAIAAFPDVVFGAAQHLTSLNLSTCGLKDSGFSTLLAAPSTTTLDVLKVNGCSLSDKSIEALVSGSLEHLHTLDISSNKLTDAALSKLADWPGIRNVTHLRTRNNRKLSSVGFQALIDCPAFQPVQFDVGKVPDSLQTAMSDRFGAALKVL